MVVQQFWRTGLFSFSMAFLLTAPVRDLAPAFLAIALGLAAGITVVKIIRREKAGEV
jgi:hypothetical protein